MNTNINKIKDGLCQWAKANLLLLLCMLIIRIFFFLEVHYRIEVDAAQFANIMSGFVFDLYLVCHIATWLLIPFLLFYCFWPKSTSKTYTGLTIFYAVCGALLTEYYCNLMMPLDHVIFVYSPEEVKGTLTSSANVTAAPFVWFFLSMAVVVIAAILWKKIRIPAFVAIPFLAGCLAAAIIVNYSNLIRTEKHYKDHESFCLAVNQPSYSAIKIYDYFSNKNKQLFDDENGVSQEVMDAVARYQALNSQNEYLDPEYPLWRKANDGDVLGKSFNMTSDSLPPNFVFIIMEGFGQNLSGVIDAQFSPTPFIDSLKQESLYWENCLSTTARTFGVLPAIFASVPQGKSGFSQNWTPMPSHNSLLMDMKLNGYKSSYYYGGVHSFDRYDGFLKANDVDFIFVPQIDNVDSATYKLLNESHRWGLDDNEVFEYAMNRKNAQPSPRPNIDIYMTLTTHEPFVFGEVEQYEKRIEELLSRQNGLSEKELANIKGNMNIFGCFNYADECVGKLINYYKTLPEYENTIFIITGDHRMGYLPFGCFLSNVNVPLLVFSPLLKEHKSMSAVVSHLDITPSLEAYLHENYGFKTSENCHWIGNSLDTVSEFRNTKRLAFMLNNRDVVDYYEGDYLLTNNRVFKLDKNFEPEAIDDDAIIKMMKDHLNDYSVISHFTVQHDFVKKIENKYPLLNYSLDFKINTIGIFSNFLKTDGDNISVLINDKVEYGPFCQNIDIPDDAASILFDLSMDLICHDTLNGLPSIVFQSNNYNSSVILSDESGNPLNTGKWEHFHTKVTIPVSNEMNGAILKVFLYNNQHTTMEFDNLKVDAFYEKR